MAGHIEEVRATLMKSAEQVGDANVLAQHHGDQVVEVAGDYSRIAEGVQMALGGLAAVIEHSRTTFESGNMASAKLQEAIDGIHRSVGPDDNVHLPRIKYDLATYQQQLADSVSTMSENSELEALVTVLKKVESMATGNAALLTENSEAVLHESGVVGDGIKHFIEWWVSEI